MQAAHYNIFLLLLISHASFSMQHGSPSAPPQSKELSDREDTPPALPPEEPEQPSVQQLLIALATDMKEVKKEVATLKQHVENEKTTKGKNGEQGDAKTKEGQSANAEAQGEASLETEIKCCGSCGEVKTKCKCKAAAKYGVSGAVGIGIGFGASQLGCCTLQ